MKAGLYAAALGAAAFLFSAAAQADRWDKLEERIRQLESQNNGGRIAQELQQMQDDLRSLRGHMEEMDYAIQQLKVQQERNAALEARVRTLEEALVKRPTGSAVTGPAVPGGDPNNTAASVTPPAPPGAEEQAQYQAALDLLKQGRYADAVTAFRRFNEKAPNSTYSDSAHYWLGEALYMNKELPAALAEFDALLANYPQSSKRSNAQLKIGFIHYDLADYGNARTALEKVREQYAGTSAADLANQRLERMKNEGR